MLRSCTLASVALAAVAVAQNHVTSPAGFESREGSSNHDYILFKQSSMRWQQVDHTHRGVSYLMTGVAWRRDAAVANDATWTARTIGDFSLVMAHVTRGQAIVGNNLSATYADIPVVVVNPVALSLPDWTATAGTSPNPWLPTIPFDTPWIYNGADDFVWEVLYSNGMNTATGSDYGNDYQTGSGTMTASNQTAGTALGTGCIATGRAAPMALAGSFTTFVDRFALSLAASNAPAGQPTVAWLDFADPNLAFPGLCANLRSLGTLQIAMGNADPLGAANLALNLGKSPVFIGANLFFQCLALDPGQVGFPVALSNGRQFTVPVDNYNCTRAYNYTTSATGSLITSGPWYGGICTRFAAVRL